MFLDIISINYGQTVSLNNSILPVYAHSLYMVSVIMSALREVHYESVWNDEGNKGSLLEALFHTVRASGP